MMRQQGFALITVMLIVAMIAALTSGLIYQQTVQIQRSSYLLHQSQGLAVALGLERWVKQGLKLDLQNNTTDDLTEQWAQPLPPVPFAGGEVSGQLVDLNGRLNVNNLTEKNDAKRQQWRKIWQRLLQLSWQTPDAQLPQSVTAAMEDWVDADETPLENGAESDVYLLKNPPYRTANHAITRVSELKWVEGFNLARWQALQGKATALPRITKININTASEAVLMALADFMSQELVKSWLVQRQTEPAKATADFRAFVVKQAGVKEDEVNKALNDDTISVQSQFFQLNGHVRYGEAEQNLAGTFYRQDKNHVYLIQRWNQR